MNFTIQLMRLLDSNSPFTELAVLPEERDQLLLYAKNNRILFSYLEAVNTRKASGEPADIYEKELRRYVATIDAVSRISKVLTSKHLRHAIFKTVRPYRSTTVDIDIIIFGSAGDYLNANRAAHEAGYRLVEQGPSSTTFEDPEMGIGIDLYREISASHIIYMDKDTLAGYATDAYLPNGEPVRTLEPEADLAAIIAHSLVKEQMYTLSEYYTFVKYLKQIKVTNLLQIAKQNNITNAVRVHASITALLYKVAHNGVPDELHQILSNLGEEKLETTLLVRKNLKTPHKYHTLTVAKCLVESAKGEKCRRSMALQVLKMLNPRFTGKLLKLFTEHATRETY
jgi:hypothetical protein